VLNRLEPSEREAAVAAVKGFLSEGAYAPGDRIPPERELIGRLGMRRTLLRRALDSLEREGVIWRHVGKGTFVSDGGDYGDAGDLAALTRQLTPVRMVRARLCIEPALAREAAINASREAVTRLRLAMERAHTAASWSDYEAQDDRFHRAVAEASDNILLLSLFDQLNQARRAIALANVVRQSQRPPATHSSFAEHERISAAIEARDPAAAHEAMRQHIGSVSARLFGEE
jgi:DNA-binding FadR family transcriptional regulator